MQEQIAIRMLKGTFDNNFDINRFSTLIKEIFNKFDLRIVDYGERIWSGYKDYIW